MQEFLPFGIPLAAAVRELSAASGRGSITTSHEVALDEFGTVEIAVFRYDDFGLNPGCFATVIKKSHQHGGIDVGKMNACDVDAARGRTEGETVGIGWYGSCDGEGTIEHEIVLETGFITQGSLHDASLVDRVVGIGAQCLFAIVGSEHAHLIKQVDGAKR